MKLKNLEGEERTKEFEKLQKENEEIRKKLDKLIGLSKNKTIVWREINELVENELKQEELCD